MFLSRSALPPQGKRGVHNVHTLGFGSGSTGGGLGRTAEVFGGVAEIQGPEPGSSPTSGTVFPQVRGPLGSLAVHKSSFMGSFVAVAGPGGSILWVRRLWAGYFFMVVRGLGDMTCSGA